MRGNGKGKFYRTLKFDKKTWQIVKDFNKIKQEMVKDLDKKRNIENDE